MELCGCVTGKCFLGYGSGHALHEALFMNTIRTVKNDEEPRSIKAILQINTLPSVPGIIPRWIRQRRLGDSGLSPFLSSLKCRFFATVLKHLHSSVSLSFSGWDLTGLLVFAGTGAAGGFCPFPIFLWPAGELIFEERHLFLLFFNLNEEKPNPS